MIHQQYIHLICFTLIISLVWKCICADNSTTNSNCQKIDNQDGSQDIYCSMEEWTPTMPFLPQTPPEKLKINGLQIIFTERLSKFKSDYLEGYSNLRWISFVDRGYYRNTRGFIEFEGENVFRHTPRLESFYSNVAIPHFNVLPKFQRQPIPIKQFEILLNCSSIDYEAINFIKLTVQNLIIKNKCFDLKRLYIMDKTYESFNELKSLEVEYFSFVGSEVSPYIISRNYKLEDLKFHLTGTLLFKNSVNKILLYDLPALRSIFFESIRLSSSHSNSRVCKKLSENVREIRLYYCLLDILQACPDVWVCKSCNSKTDDQLVLIKKSFYRALRSANGRYRKLTISELLPQNISDWYQINTTRLEIINTDIYLDDLSRFAQLTSLTHMRAFIYDATFEQTKHAIDCPPFKGINPFKSLPNREKLQTVSLSFARCDCDVYNTKLWFRDNLPNTKFKLFCDNFACGSEQARDFMWVDDEIFIEAMSRYCKPGQTNVTIPEHLMDCSRNNNTGETVSTVLSTFILVLLTFLYIGS